MSTVPGGWTAVPIQKDKRPIWPWIILGAGLLLALAIASCFRTISAGGDQSDKAMAAFHAQMDANSCSQIYADATEGFRDATPESDWQAVCSNIPKKMGTYLRSSRQFVNVSATTSGRFVTVTYASEFSEGKGEEKFVWKLDGTQVRLHGYTLNSPRLLMK